MNSFIEVIWQYRLHALIVVFIALLARFAYFYRHSPKSPLVITQTYVIDDDTELSLATLKRKSHRDLRYLIKLVHQYDFAFAGLIEMNYLRYIKKLPLGITIASVHNQSVLLFDVCGEVPYTLKTLSIDEVSANDKYTRFAIIRSRRVPVGKSMPESVIAA